MPSALSFEIIHQAVGNDARVGRVTTPHGSFDTPAFMPVGTLGAIKGVLPEQVAETGSQIILANTYHLMLRPGSELVAQMGGLHRWMRWDGPILTDSGGFQVFSLAHISKINEDGVIFRSHLDGQTVELTPDRSIAIQNDLGADIIMALDDCPPAKRAAAPDPPHADRPRAAVPTRRAPLGAEAYGQRVQSACERSARWLDQCVKAHGRREDQALFGIVQGGTDLTQRTWCAHAVCQHDLPGFAIGGVAVGEGYEGLKIAVEHTAPLLPSDRPRYLMGVGYEQDILTAVRAGVDLFDCVLPTRNGRNATAFTPFGHLRLRNARYASDGAVIDAGCDCSACRGGFSRSYIRHLFQAGEMLGPILVSLHNLRHFQRYLLDIRRAILENSWPCLAQRWPVTVDHHRKTLDP